MEITTINATGSVLLKSGHIDASKWAKSVGLKEKCKICEVSIKEIARDKTSEMMHLEELASLSMAILNKVKRVLAKQSEVTFTFLFKPTWGEVEQEFEVVLERCQDGNDWLIVKKVRSENRNYSKGLFRQ